MYLTIYGLYKVKKRQSLVKPVTIFKKFISCQYYSNLRTIENKGKERENQVKNIFHENSHEVTQWSQLGKVFR